MFIKAYGIDKKASPQPFDAGSSRLDMPKGGRCTRADSTLRLGISYRLQRVHLHQLWMGCCADVEMRCGPEHVCLMLSHWVVPVGELKQNASV